MRIVFTTKIAPVISQADVSHNGLFIGLWTEAEVSLGFIVACSLCLPKLVQVKGRSLRNAISYASAPWSSLNNKSRKSWTWNSSQNSSQHESRSSRQMKQVDVERPMYYEERVEQERQGQIALRPEINRHDIYLIPSTAGNSVYTPSRYSESRYSRSIGSRRTSLVEGDILTATRARPALPRTISVRTQEVPVCLDPAGMTMEQWADERRMLQQFDFEDFEGFDDREPARLTAS